MANQVHKVQVIWNAPYIISQPGHLAWRTYEQYWAASLQVGLHLPKYASHDALHIFRALKATEAGNIVDTDMSNIQAISRTAIYDTTTPKDMR